LKNRTAVVGALRLYDESVFNLAAIFSNTIA